VEDFAVVAARSTIMPGIRVGTRSLVAAGALVTRDVAPDTVVGGVPARVLGATGEVRLRDGSGRAAYPWMRHFHRGYPPEVIAAWQAAFGELEPWTEDEARAEAGARR
jgi:carbonic anhydrase/acetyltransferase-like protein (isoleucine patch superfamily)